MKKYLALVVTLIVAGCSESEPEFAYGCLSSEDSAGIELAIASPITQAPARINVIPVHDFPGRAELDVAIYRDSVNVWAIHMLLANLDQATGVNWDLLEIPAETPVPNGNYHVVARAIDLVDGYSACQEADLEVATN